MNKYKKNSVARETFDGRSLGRVQLPVCAGDRAIKLYTRNNNSMYTTMDR